MSDQPASGTAAIPSSPESARRLEQARVIQSALQSSITRIYSNSFAMAQSESDVSLISLFNGNPNAIVSMSYITAKSLAVELQKVVANFEEAYSEKVKTIEEIAPKLREVMVRLHVPKL